MSSRVAIVLAAGIALSGPRPATGQSLLERPPNLRGTDVRPGGRAGFEFLHRFELVGEGDEKVLNFPTFLLGLGLGRSADVGMTYASNSEVGGDGPNEWEAWARKRFAPGERLEIAGTVAWNTATESVDGEAAVRLGIDRLRLHGAVRGFADAFRTGESAAALAGGVVLRLTPRLSLGADAAGLLTDLETSTPTAWSAGVQLAIPGSPHTLGLVASNVGSTTLQGASRGVEDLEGDGVVRYGFAFTMPLGTLDQWARIFHGAGAESADVPIRDFAFEPSEIRIRPGETVRWVNEDPVVHTVTADDGAFDSGPIQPGEGYSRRFDEPGEYPYHCTPHPFMKAVVIVEPV